MAQVNQIMAEMTRFLEVSDCITHEGYSIWCLASQTFSYHTDFETITEIEPHASTPDKPSAMGNSGTVTKLSTTRAGNA
jgi:hypothetical protein